MLLLAACGWDVWRSNITECTGGEAEQTGRREEGERHALWLLFAALIALTALPGSAWHSTHAAGQEVGSGASMLHSVKSASVRAAAG